MKDDPAVSFLVIANPMSIVIKTKYSSMSFAFDKYLSRSSDTTNIKV